MCGNYTLVAPALQQLPHNKALGDLRSLLFGSVEDCLFTQKKTRKLSTLLSSAIKTIAETTGSSQACGTPSFRTRSTAPFSTDVLHRGWKCYLTFLLQAFFFYAFSHPREK